MIYVNYGREEDFHWLKTEQNVDFEGSVVIARYGKIFRADKVTLAAKYGAKAAILYSDPYDSSSPTDNSSYPDSWWLPSTGVQRGTVKGVDGDPTTPMYPSLDSAFRVLPEESAYLPKIPVHSISYGDAANFLQRLGGEEVPEPWRGSIPGVTYRFGGEFPESDLKVKVHITTHNVRRKTYNVIGYIDGAVEPDRYVVSGNHRDAWVYGSVDPTSGTAAMIEVNALLPV
ncbi:hypothetical protein EB796_022315 [Bugula neritina]|uniref:PA domain-containing protein n=1 Tax=Bugula neritina TaxID=10212 RepID=A0A7J7J1N2_BUGNE|nr:hypothetical protein EB796_022315 [Bugula neritina]